MTYEGIQLFSENIEMGRRDLSVRFRDTIEQEDPSMRGRLLPTEAILLLLLASWDIEQAMQDWTGLQDALCRLHARFDHLRSHIQRGVDVQDPNSHNLQSERLALAIILTGWWSIRISLQDNDWDLVTSVTR
jgi:hypothetical protein